MHVKVDRRLNVTYKFKYQRRLSSRLPIVMFRGTPCIYKYIFSGNPSQYNYRVTHKGWDDLKRVKYEYEGCICF